MDRTTETATENNDICRVCRSSATADEPLFHPCKCSGSMKFVHQSCLEEWLQHSGKSDCDICKQQFIFSPIYDNNSSKTISPLLIVSVTISSLLASIYHYFRVTLAAFSWLVWFPFITSWTWKWYLDSGFYQLRTLHYHPPVNRTAILMEQVANLLQISPDNSLFYNLRRLELALDWDYYVRVFVADTFEGQLICALIILVGLALLFMREYAVMIARDDQEIENIEGANEDAAIPQINQANFERQQQIELFEAVNEERLGNGALPNVLGEQNDDQLQVNIGINVNIENGIFAAEINANGDVAAFLELIGVNGSVLLLFRNVACAHLLMAIALAICVLIPNKIGHFSLYVLKDVYIPFVQWCLEVPTELVRNVIDPIIDPILDYTLNAWPSIIKEAAPPANSSNSFFDWAKLLAFPSSTNSSILEIMIPNSTRIYGGPYHPDFFSAFGDHVLWTVFGWVNIIILALIWSVRCLLIAGTDWTD